MSPSALKEYRSRDPAVKRGFVMSDEFGPWAKLIDKWLKHLPEDRDAAVSVAMGLIAIWYEDTWREGGEIDKLVHKMIDLGSEKGKLELLTELREEYNLVLTPDQVRTLFESEGWEAVAQAKLPAVLTAKQVAEILNYSERQARRRLNDLRP